MATIDFTFFMLNSDIVATLKNKDWNVAISRNSKDVSRWRSQAHGPWLNLFCTHELFSPEGIQNVFELFASIEIICWWDQKVKIPCFSGQVENLMPGTLIAPWPHRQELKPGCLLRKRVLQFATVSPELLQAATSPGPSRLWMWTKLKNRSRMHQPLKTASFLKRYRALLLYAL